MRTIQRHGSMYIHDRTRRMFIEQDLYALLYSYLSHRRYNIAVGDAVPSFVMNMLTVSSPLIERVIYAPDDLPEPIAEVSAAGGRMPSFEELDAFVSAALMSPGFASSTGGVLWSWYRSP